jgi:hypothetical protein
LLCQECFNMILVNNPSFYNGGVTITAHRNFAMGHLNTRCSTLFHLT